MCFISSQMGRRWRSLSEHCIPPSGSLGRAVLGKCGKILFSFLSYYMFTSQVPMVTSSSIRHWLNIEIPGGKFVEITSILKAESTWKLWHRLGVDMSMWIRLSKSTKYWWVLHVDFSVSFRRQIDVTSVLAVFILLFPNIFCSGNLF